MKRLEMKIERLNIEPWKKVFITTFRSTKFSQWTNPVKIFAYNLLLMQYWVAFIINQKLSLLLIAVLPYI